MLYLHPQISIYKAPSRTYIYACMYKHIGQPILNYLILSTTGGWPELPLLSDRYSNFIECHWHKKTYLSKCITQAEHPPYPQSQSSIPLSTPNHKAGCTWLPLIMGERHCSPQITGSILYPQSKGTLICLPPITGSTPLLTPQKKL